jgi:hypothetical protein
MYVFNMYEFMYVRMYVCTQVKASRSHGRARWKSFPITYRHGVSDFRGLNLCITDPQITEVGRNTNIALGPKARGAIIRHISTWTCHDALPGDKESDLWVPVLRTCSCHANPCEEYALHIHKDWCELLVCVLYSTRYSIIAGYMLYAILCTILCYSSVTSGQALVSVL